MRTRCVTLLLCIVCGLTLHAADTRAHSESWVAIQSSHWRPSEPVAVFSAGDAAGATPVVQGWNRPGTAEEKTIAHCKLLIANCKLDTSIEAPLEVDPSSLQFAICTSRASGLNGRAQFAIPFDRDGTEPRYSNNDRILLVGDAPDIDSAFVSPSSVAIRDDLRGFLPGVWRDARGVVSTENMLILSAALAASIGIRQDLDDEVREEGAANPDRWGDASRVLGHLGEAPFQVPILGLLWATSLWTNDAELNGLSHTLFSAYTINGLAVLAIKGIADTDRPDADWNGGRWGFPSFHAASAFTIAGVLEEYYGWSAGLPAYSLAGLISWSRIDQRDHDLSDVAFGAALGWVIGKSVAGQHLRGDGRVLLLPWSHPLERANGIMLEVRY